MLFCAPEEGFCSAPPQFPSYLLSPFSPHLCDFSHPPALYPYDIVRKWVLFAFGVMPPYNADNISQGGCMDSLKDRLFHYNFTYIIVIFVLIACLLFGLSGLPNRTEGINEAVKISDTQLVFRGILIFVLVIGSFYSGLWAYFHRDT